MKSLIIIALTTLLLFLCGKHLFSVESEYTSQLLTHSEQKFFLHKFKNFSLTNTNAAGKIDTVIHSPWTHYFADKHTTVMDTPEMLMHREQASPITMTSKTAEVFHLKNITILENDVNVLMTKPGKQAVRLTTEKLTLDNTLQIATTDLPASIFHGKGEMHGKGLEFNPHTKQIKFLNEVRGYYEN